MFSRFRKQATSFLALLLPLGLAALSTLPAQSPAGTTTMRLSEIAIVEGDSVRLRDILHPPHRAELSAQLLFENLTAPRYLSGDELRRRLLDEQRISDSSELHGRGVWIVPLARELQGEELSVKLRREIERLPRGVALLERLDLQVEPQARLRLPSGGVAPLEMRLVLPEDLRRVAPGRWTLAVDLYGDGRLLHRQRLPLVWQQGSVAASVSATLLPALTVVADQVVRQNSRVRYYYSGRGFTLSVPAEALEQGEVGDQIEVRLILPEASSSGAAVRKARVRRGGVVEAIGGLE